MAAESGRVIGGRVPLVTVEIAVGTERWQVTAVENQDLLLDHSEELQHFPFGFLLWESTVGMARHLLANPELVRGKRVLELGAGVGVAGMAAQFCGAAVCQTDHQKEALELAAGNARQNNIQGIARFLADWRAWSHQDRYDVLLGADITYERTTQPDLERIFSGNLAPGGTVLLADPGRPQTLEMAARLEHKGWRIDIETRAVPMLKAGQAQRAVEVTILSMQPPDLSRPAL